MPEQLTVEERRILLRIARETLEKGLRGEPLPGLDLEQATGKLSDIGASFVTLLYRGQLRGCIGALEAYQPLMEDVIEHTLAAALCDYRFPPVTLDELPDIQIEISYLTEPRVLDYACSEELLTSLRPGVDGVVLKDGPHKATFLPQVWEKLCDPELFLNLLCQKMGAIPDTWKRKKLQVYTYQVEEFHE